jgi:hypothetical protein
MKKILRSTVIAAASVASMLSIPHGKPEPNRQKKQRASTQPRGASKAPPPTGPLESDGLDEKAPPLRTKETVLALITAAESPHVPAPIASHLATPAAAPAEAPAPVAVADRYPWKRDIVTTTFWIGEKPSKNNPVPNRASSWDRNWAANYGGTDTPVRNEREDFHPAAFEPGQNPFYVALPYNDVQMSGHKPEAKKIVPWFREEYRGPGQSVCKGRWVAIRFKGRTVYAQWEDCGPFRTDHSAYVFGDERPKKNLNKGAGLDVSPAVRDYLGMDDTDVTDWKFVDFDEVPHGPWAKYGENNTFVLNRRLNELHLAALAAMRRTPE